MFFDNVASNSVSILYEFENSGFSYYKYFMLQNQLILGTLVNQTQVKVLKKW